MESSPATYQQTIVQPVTSSHSHPGLRSAACPTPVVVLPRQRPWFAERAFSYADLAAWNTLSVDVRCTTGLMGSAPVEWHGMLMGNSEF